MKFEWPCSCQSFGDFLLQEPTPWAMGVAHALNSIALQTIAHGVGAYNTNAMRGLLRKTSRGRSPWARMIRPPCRF